MQCTSHIATLPRKCPQDTSGPSWWILHEMAVVELPAPRFILNSERMRQRA